MRPKYPNHREERNHEPDDSGAPRNTAVVRKAQNERRKDQPDPSEDVERTGTDHLRLVLVDLWVNVRPDNNDAAFDVEVLLAVVVVKQLALLVRTMPRCSRG